MVAAVDTVHLEEEVVRREAVADSQFIVGVLRVLLRPSPFSARAGAHHRAQEFFLLLRRGEPAEGAEMLAEQNRVAHAPRST